MSVTKDKKQATMKKYGRSKMDTGSCEVQVALLTSRINELTEHFKTHKKDHHSRRGLIRMVETRKKLLRYLEKESSDRYKKIIAELDLRK